MDKNPHQVGATSEVGGHRLGGTRPEEVWREIRRCTSCGFCTATCPTYLLTGDELDGPRGRIAQVRWLLEGNAPTEAVRTHLDRCLTCLACETACPSGVGYHRIVDFGRKLVERTVPPSLPVRIKRWLLQRTLPYFDRPARLFVNPLFRWPKPRHAKRAILFEGCVQPLLAPEINFHAARLLDRIGISPLRVYGNCCGALHDHTGAPERALALARRNLDAFWPYVERGVPVITTASGCGWFLKQYGELLEDRRAKRFSEQVYDLGEVLPAEGFRRAKPFRRIVFQIPCTLQHGLRTGGPIEKILREAGYQLVPVAESHLCCGSAGAYSILQPELARKLRRRKLDRLMAGEPEGVATANIGCLLFLRPLSPRPIAHWVELIR